MRFIGFGVVLLAALAAACGGAPLQSCSLGLAPGSPEFERCGEAQAARRAAATAGAVETLRALDVRGIGMH